MVTCYVQLYEMEYICSFVSSRFIRVRIFRGRESRYILLFYVFSWKEKIEKVIIIHIFKIKDYIFDILLIVL